MRPVETTRWGWVVLFVSSGTLVCCALPILLVTLGLGAVSASLFATLPFLTTLALHKTWLFAGSAVLLVFAAWSLFRPNRSCPSDPLLAARCDAAHRWNKRLFLVSSAVWLLGFTAAYLSVPMLNLLG